MRRLLELSSRRSAICAAVIGVLLLSGCIVLPLPEHGDGKTPWIPREAVEKLAVGKSSRTDVVMLLGEPGWRTPDDGAFEYWWNAIVGLVGIGGVGAPGVVGDITRPRRLCLLFDGNGTLAGKQYVQPGILQGKEASCAARSDGSAGEEK